MFLLQLLISDFIQAFVRVKDLCCQQGVEPYEEAQQI